MRGIVSLFVLLLLCACAPVFADSADRLYEVIGVASSDELNVREEPSPDARKVAAVPFNARGLRVRRCVSVIDDKTGQQSWCAIDFMGVTGWVNARYIRPAASSVPPAQSEPQGAEPSTIDVPPPPTPTPIESVPPPAEPNMMQRLQSEADKLSEWLLPQNFWFRSVVAAGLALVLLIVFQRALKSLTGRPVPRRDLESPDPARRSAPRFIVRLLGQVFSFGFFFSVLMLLLAGKDFAPTVAYYIDRYLIQGIDDKPVDAASIERVSLVQATENDRPGYHDEIEDGTPTSFAYYRDEFAAGRIAKNTLHRRRSFRTQFGADVWIFLWPKNCSRDGCLYDFLQSGGTASLKPLASIRAFNLQRTSAFKNGFPIFIDAQSRLFWWDGEKFVIQPLLTQTEASVNDYLRVSPQALRRCQQVWHTRDGDDEVWYAPGQPLRLRGMLFQFDGDWDGIAAVPPVCVRAAGTTTARPMFGLYLDSLRKQLADDKDFDRHRDELYGEEVEVVCEEAWFHVTGLVGPSSARCTVQSMYRVANSGFEGPFDRKSRK